MQFILGKRFFKKLFFGCFYLAIFSLIIFFIFQKITERRTPSPQPPQEPSILEAKFVPSQENKGDVVFKVKNPNEEMGLISFIYQISLTNEIGEIIEEKKGYDFLLPRQTKYIFSFDWPVSQEEVKHIKIKITSFNWKKFKEKYHQWLTVRDIRDHLGFSLDEPYYWLEGVLTNHSALDLEKVEIKAIIRDEKNQIITLSQTNQEIVKSLEERHFKIVWPKATPRMKGKDINSFRIEVYPEANFMKYF